MKFAKLRIPFRRISLTTTAFLILLSIHAKTQPNNAPHLASSSFDQKTPRVIHDLESSARRPPHCVHIIPPDTPVDEWKPFNARSFCVTDRMCISPRTLSRPSTLHHDHNPISTAASKPSCKVSGPSLTVDVANNVNCSELHRSVYCAQGQYYHNATGFDVPCPQMRSFSPQPFNATWVRGLAIVIPAYAFLGNIFHFTQALAPAAQIIAHLPSLVTPVPTEVTLVFRGRAPLDLGKWQDGITQAITTQRLNQMGVRIHVHTLLEDEPFVAESGFLKVAKMRPVQNTVCMNASIIIGARYVPTLWPFASEHHAAHWPFRDNLPITHVGTDKVPFEAVAFKQAVYKYTQQPTVIRGNVDNFQSLAKTSSMPERKLLLDLPPLSLTYARRNKRSYIVPGMDYNQRRLNEDDDSWFTHTLKQEAKWQGFKFRIAEPNELTAFKEQVRTFRQSGIVVGLHGANLMNSVFTPSFGALIEISPLTFTCYISGANSGLKYWHFKPSRESTAECVKLGLNGTNCDEVFHRNYRRVILDDSADRIMIINVVRLAFKHVRRMNRWFGHLGGIPVVYVELAGVYRIDWSRRSSWISYGMKSARDAILGFGKRKRRTPSLR